MRIVRFLLDGQPSYGLLTGNEIEALAGNPMNGISKTGRKQFIGDSRLLAPVQPSKVVCIGMNYSQHAAELGLDLPEEPTVFLKAPSAIVGPGASIVVPKQTKRVELEVELVVVIGKEARRIRKDEADDYIFGYTIANDVTARDLQFEDQQWARSKSFDSFCPIGPWIETDWQPQNQRLESRVDGSVRQADTIDRMIHSVPEIVAYVSENMTLLPGDVILTGTPAGISEIRSGELVECQIDGLGTLLNQVS